MDAVEAVMREDGYGALSARSVATKANLKHQLVYYYFETLDDLLVATYERHMDRYLQRSAEAFRSERPLHAFWRVHADPADAALNMEFLAMANHHEAIRVRTIAFGEKVRLLGLDRLDTLLRQNPAARGPVNAYAVTMAITSIGSVLGLEAAIGISGGHKELRAMIEWAIDQLEPPT